MFVRELHDFKEDSMESTVKLIQSKFKSGQTQNGKLVDEIKEDMMDFLRI